MVSHGIAAGCIGMPYCCYSIMPWHCRGLAWARRWRCHTISNLKKTNDLPAAQTGKYACCALSVVLYSPVRWISNFPSRQEPDTCPLESSGVDLSRTLLIPSKCSVNHWFVHLLRYRVLQKKLIKWMLPWHIHMRASVFWGSGSGALGHKNSNSVCNVVCAAAVLVVCMYESQTLVGSQDERNIAAAQLQHNTINGTTSAKSQQQQQ